MAITAEELAIKISLQGENVTKNLNEISKELKGIQQSSSKSEKSLNDFAASFSKLSIAAFGAVKAIQFISGSIGGMIAGFAEASDAVTRLNQSLEISGVDNISKISADFQELGDSIQSFGVASKEQVLNIAKIGISAGNSSEQIKVLINAAADLSTARDIPLESAFKALSSTLKGSAGALASFIPELKDMTEAQAKAGLAIEYVSALLGGTASRNIETISGRLAVLKTKFGDVGQEIGSIIFDILTMNDVIGRSGSFLDNLKNMLISNRDTLISFGDTVIKIFNSIVNSVTDTVLVFIRGFAAIKQALGTLIEGLGSLLSVFEKFKVWAGNIKQFGSSMYDSATVTKDAAQYVLNYSDTMEKANTAIEKTNKSNEKSLQRIKDQISGAKDATKAWEDLQNKLNDYEKATKTAGLEGANLARAKADADNKEIEALYKKIKAAGQVSAEQEKAYKRAKALIEQSSQSEIDKIHLDSLEKILLKNKEIEAVTKSIGSTKIQQIDNELELQLELLDLEAKKLDLMDQASLKAIENQKNLLREQAAKKKSETPMELTDWVKALGKAFASGDILNIAKNIGGTISSAFSSVAGYIGGFIDVFMNADKYLKALIEFPKQFIEILKNLPQLVQQVIAEFPNLMTKLAEVLPVIILKIAEMIPSFVEAIVTNLPTLFERLAEIIPELFVKIVAMIPRVIPILIRAVLQIAQGIIKGLIRGISNLGTKMPNLKIDEKSIDSFKKVLSDNSKRLFAVEDVMAKANQDGRKADKTIGTQIENAFKRGKNFFVEAWDFTVNMLKSIWDSLTGAIKDVVNLVVSILEDLVKVFTYVFENFGEIITTLGQGLVDSVKVFFETVGELVTIIVDTVSQIGTMIWDVIVKVFDEVAKLLTPLFDAILSIPKMLIDTVLEFVDILTAAFKTLWDGIASALSPIGDFLSSFLESVLKVPQMILDAVVEIGSAIWQAISGAFEWVKSVLWQALTEPFNWIKDVLWTALSEPFIWIKKNIFEPFANLLSGIFDPIVNLFKDIGKAGGGVLDSIGKVLGLSKGGAVYASDGLFVPRGTDTVPAMLTPGEFVMSRPAVEGIGLNNLRSMNSTGTIPATGSIYNLSFEIRIDAKTNLDESYIRSTLVPRMTDELKRASLDGKFVLSAKGIR